MLALLGSLVASALKFLTIEFAKAALIRVLILTALTLVLPVVLYNVFSLVLSEMLAYVSSHVTSSGIQGAVIELVGIAAWVGALLKIPESVSFLLSCGLCRMVLGMIRPF
jgi:hypothetical protein